MLKTYQRPEIHYADYRFDMMLDIHTSDGFVDDEAAKDRGNDDTSWGNNEKNGYGNLW